MKKLTLLCSTLLMLLSIISCSNDIQNSDIESGDIENNDIEINDNEDSEVENEETENKEAIDCKSTPTLITQDIINITDTSVKFSGQIIKPTCENSVTSQGFVYAKTTLPKSDDFVVEVSGENISSDISNLEQNTSYFMRTFFENPTGTYYGNQVEFTTAIGNIEVTTKEIESITDKGAVSGVIISGDGGSNIISRGICWSTSANPTILDFKIEDSSSDFNFDSDLTGLVAGTSYFVRAFITNENGTSYGNEKRFTTLNSLYKVELQITGYIDSCGVQADHFYYELNYKFDDGKINFDAAEGFEDWSYTHSKEERVKNDLEVSIHLHQFDTNNPSEEYKGAYLDNMTLVITNMTSNQEVLNIALPSLFICTDTAYKNIIKFNVSDDSYTIDTLTYGF
ncbi:hypothetical protein [Zobellia nedashkovskayae]|uniref:hypothetical protein n=1 Tax=Zobellia nedashkovskayae TaxID=2779510 RepID=UPI00188B4D9B|nr:hypothetical protein [Zobellia nedashkovskayae]